MASSIRSTPGCRTPPGDDHLLNADVGGHPPCLDVVLLGRLEVGLTEQVERDADLFRGAVDQLGDRAVPEEVGPDGLTEGLPGP